jgi:hypothetical protein
MPRIVNWKNNLDRKTIYSNIKVNRSGLIQIENIHLLVVHVKS